MPDEYNPDLATKESVAEFLDRLMATLPWALGVDELISGCEVINLDPYGVGLGTYPRWLRVSLRGREHVDVYYRGGISGLVVGDFVTIAHIRDGDRYEIITAGGAGGSLPAPAPVDAQYLTLLANAVLTQERIFTPGSWVAGTDGGAGGAYALDFEPDNPVVISGGVVTEYATITLALAGAGAGDTVLIPPGDYNETITLVNGVLVRGFGPRADIRILGVEDIVTSVGGGYLEHVTLVQSGDCGGGNNGVIRCNHAAGTCVFRDIAIEGTHTGAAGLLYGVHVTNNGETLIDILDVVITANGANGQAGGVGLTADNPTVKLRNGTFDLTSVNWDVYALVCGAGTLWTQDCRIETSAGGANDYHVWQAAPGTLGVYAVQYDPTLIFGEITHLQGDAHFPANPFLYSAGQVTEYMTIAAALTAAGAGDTVYIPPGIYAETITLVNGVYVRGIGPREAIRITGGGTTGTVVNTVGGGYLEHVTLDTTKTTGGSLGVIEANHTSGVCTLRDIKIEGEISVNLGVWFAGIDWNPASGTPELDCELINIEMEDTPSPSGNTVYGIRQQGPSGGILYFKMFTIECTSTAGGAYGIYTAAGNGYYQEGKITCTGSIDRDFWITGGAAHIYMVQYDIWDVSGLPTRQMGDRGDLVFISTVSLGAPAASISFTNVPQQFLHFKTHTHLRTDREAEGDYCILRLNGDNGNNYDSELLRSQGAGTSGTPLRGVNNPYWAACEAANSRANAYASGWGYLEYYRIPAHERYGWSGSGRLGNVDNNNDMWCDANRYRWRNTNAVTTLTFLPGTGPNFVAGSRIDLYGVFPST